MLADQPGELDLALVRDVVHAAGSLAESSDAMVWLTTLSSAGLENGRRTVGKPAAAGIGLGLRRLTIKMPGKLDGARQTHELTQHRSTDRWIGRRIEQQRDDRIVPADTVKLEHRNRIPLVAVLKTS